MSDRYIEKSQTTEVPSGMTNLQIEGYSKSMVNPNKADAPSLPNLALDNEKQGLIGKNSQEGTKTPHDGSSADHNGGGGFKGSGKGGGFEK